MEKLLNSDSVKSALETLGWSQKQLAEEVGVTSQAVTNWLKGADFPRPDKLLKLALSLSLDFDKLVKLSAKEPVVAFRKKGNAITTEDHLSKASSMGTLLKSLVPYLPESNALRTQIPSPSTEYDKLHSIASAIRARIGIGEKAVLEYMQLINEFNDNGAIIIPSMWGSKQNHGNALHILLPDENVTFIYLNLDTHIEDFKFWMAHELAHVYTPELAGTDEGEDFADALAGALLFPKELAQATYNLALNSPNKTAQIQILRKQAHQHEISLYSVFCEVLNYANASKLPPLLVSSSDIHAIRNMARGHLISQAIFAPDQPDASRYIAASKSIFNSSFFDALQKMLKELNTGSGYVQQLLDISLKDATALHSELLN